MSILRQKGADAAVTTVMGGDVDPVLDDDEDDDPFVDVSESVEAERAKTTLLPRRHAKKGKTVPKLNTSEPDPSWSDSEIELTGRAMTRTTRLRLRPQRQLCCRVAMQSAARSPDSFRWRTIRTRLTSPSRRFP